MRTLTTTLALATTMTTLAAAQQKAVPAAATSAATWQIDVVHSELTFRVRHLTGRVRGSFKVWEGTIVADPAALAQGSVRVSIDAGSVNTENADRDNHLRSPEFLDAATYPAITFASRSVQLQGEALTLAGDLTIHGVTKPVVLTGRFGGAITDPWGKQRVAFEAATTINRKDFGLTWGKMVEGVALVGDEVQIELAVEAVKS